MESGGGSSVASSACFSPFSISLKLALFAPFSDAVSLSLRLLCGHDGSLDHSTRPRPESASAERATAKRERATSDARILRGLKRELLPINRSLASLFSSHPHHPPRLTAPVRLAADVAFAFVAIGSGGGGRRRGLFRGGAEQERRRGRRSQHRRRRRRRRRRRPSENRHAPRLLLSERDRSSAARARLRGRAVHDDAV